MKRLLALLGLGLRMIAHILAMPSRMAGDGERRFLENYRADGLAPLLVEERNLLPKLDRCIGCGLCNAVCDRLIGAPRALFSGPFALAASARSMPDFARFVPGDGPDCRDCARCESVCPTGVPLRDLAEFVRARSER